MMSLWKIIRSFLAIGGFALLFCAASTSDYYVIELGQMEPAGFSQNLVVGLLMILPQIIHLVYDMYKEGKREDVQD